MSLGQIHGDVVHLLIDDLHEQKNKIILIRQLFSLFSVITNNRNIVLYISTDS